MHFSMIFRSANFGENFVQWQLATLQLTSGSIFSGNFDGNVGGNFERNLAGICRNLDW